MWEVPEYLPAALYRNNWRWEKQNRSFEVYCMWGVWKGVSAWCQRAVWSSNECGGSDEGCGERQLLFYEFRWRNDIVRRWNLSSTGSCESTYWSSTPQIYSRSVGNRRSCQMGKPLESCWIGGWDTIWFENNKNWAFCTSGKYFFKKSVKQLAQFNCEW